MAGDSPGCGVMQYSWQLWVLFAKTVKEWLWPNNFLHLVLLS